MSLETKCRNMFLNVFRLIKSLFIVSVPEQHKREFSLAVNKINISRAKATAVTFIVLESILIIMSFSNSKNEFPDLYYRGMYALMLTAMIVYLLVFRKWGKNIAGNKTIIEVGGIFFACIILYWCVGISLLDQLSYGQIIVYISALLAIAVVPLFSPLVSLFLYCSSQILFIALLPYFQRSPSVLYGNYVNSSTFVVLAWVISRMRYVNFVEDFEYKKIIQEKNDELARVNQELGEANRILKKLSQIDGVTGIFNRSVFDQVMLAEWDRCGRHSIPLSLIIIDIDFFKTLNDHYGHQAGDDCLRQVAKLLRACTKRSSDTVARYGGDEFAIILPHMEKEDAVKFAEQLRKKVSKLVSIPIPREYSSVLPDLTISLGVATIIPSPESSIKEFINAADQALYEAKKERNKIVVT